MQKLITTATDIKNDCLLKKDLSLPQITHDTCDSILWKTRMSQAYSTYSKTLQHDWK